MGDAHSQRHGSPALLPVNKRDPSHRALPTASPVYLPPRNPTALTSNLSKILDQKPQFSQSVAPLHKTGSTSDDEANRVNNKAVVADYNASSKMKTFGNKKKKSATSSSSGE